MIISSGRRIMLMFVIMTLLHGVLCSSPSLFKKFPPLASKIAYTALCDLPTPIIKADNFAKKVGHSAIYIKRDDLSGKEVDGYRSYGGNKPRKLEWLLADALQKDAHTIVTYGCFGSNHATATAFYAHALGLRSILMLTPQPNSEIVRQNLLLDHALGAQLVAFSNGGSRDVMCKQIMADDPHAYFIPTGGSTSLGALGFVNAACELSEQIQANVMPEPDVIYIPIGTCGTVAGLLLGLKINNVKTKVVAVATCRNLFEEKVQKLFMETNRLLHEYDNTIPIFDFPHDSFVVNRKYCESYGVWTEKDLFSIALLKELEGIQLEGTYSSKSICACIDDALNGRLATQTVLIWNTYCGLDFTNITNCCSYTDLPVVFHHYFE